MTKPQLRTFFINMLKTCGDMKTSTVSVSGTKDVSVWEWNIEFKAVGLMPHEDGVAGAEEKEWAARVADGREVKMIGISVTWWNEDGTKIVKNNDYGKVVKSFEGRR